MNLIIQHILDHNTPAGPQAECDTVRLQWFEADRRILRKTSTGGRDIAFRLLKEGQRLRHGDVVYADSKLLIRIEIEPSEVTVLSPQTLPDMARACYEIGNKHAPLFLDGDELIMPYEPPMFAWLDAAGFSPRRDRRRLSEQLRANSAQGAGGHSHDHHHPHSHGHHHEHHHG
ncbi:urease accessory protein UreE [Uruburuella testudinis]|uniref:Urease accessory protein UreE n=1 Tax=Uruburuella testudinis TaxID=1282863 RepID=A0ABY4DUF8_9NEIS|nr:urease accessory protein UreE [Uruburuella testudinis]UOO82078.1 urease accessory protein UreE [Uruburuella testudinis]